MISQTGLNPNQICLEITEEEAIIHSDQMETLNRLRIQGLGLAIDDFGTGYTSMSQLRNYPFTKNLKVDRSLIGGISKDKLAQTMVRSILSITSELGMQVILEGVESVEDLNYIAGFNNYSIQGYIVSKPKPLEEIIKWAKHWVKSNQMK